MSRLYAGFLRRSLHSSVSTLKRELREPFDYTASGSVACPELVEGLRTNGEKPQLVSPVRAERSDSEGEARAYTPSLLHTDLE